MLSREHRHPLDLQTVRLPYKDYKKVDGHYASVSVRNERGDWVATHLLIAKVSFSPTSDVVDMGYVSIPRWMAKNKELLLDNEPLPVDVPFP